jgi:KaiC/GvpD/RAD55 family RecA-like ATPase
MAEDFMVKTGIPGVDKVCGGGLTRGSVVTVAGTPGVGKSIFSLQYIYQGALEYGESGLFMSTEETPEMIRWHTKVLGWSEWERLEKEGLIKIVQPGIMSRAHTSSAPSFTALLDEISQHKVKRFAFDSWNTLKMFFGDERGVRVNVFRLINHIKSMGMTCLLTTETPEAFPKVYFGPEFFLSDGVILMFFSQSGASMERCFWFMKMRGQQLMTDIFPMSLDNTGVKIYPGKKPFSLERTVIPKSQFK